MADSDSRRVRLLRHFETTYNALPPLDSEEFRALLRTAPRDDLPAQVLMRAYVELGGRGESATLILTRLLEAWDAHEDPGPHVKGYLAHVRSMTTRRCEDGPSPYPPSEYIRETGRQVLRALHAECKHSSKTGERCRVTNWYIFQEHRFQDALDKLDGKPNKNDGVRPKVARLRALPHPKTGEPLVENLGGDGAPWHVAAGPTPADSDAKDLLAFLRRELRRAKDPLMEEVAEQLWFSGDPPPISKPDKDGRQPLTEILKTTRDKIRHARDRARALIRAAVHDEFGPTSAEFRLIERLTDTSKLQRHVRLSR